MQDWSRGGDGIVSLATITTIEDLKGKRISCTQFTPSHFLLLYLLSQSGLSAEDRTAVEKSIIFTQDAPAAAAMFKAKQVDAAVTWEPDLSASVTARGDEAHILVSTDRGHQHHRRHAGGAAGADRPGARHRPRLRPGVVRRHRGDQERPGGLLRDRGQGAQARFRHGVRHAVRPEADAVRRQRPVLRPDRRQGALRDAVQHGVRDLAQEGAGDAAGGREGLGRHAVRRGAGRPVSRARRSRSRRSRPARHRRRIGRSSTSRSRFTSRRAPT